MKNKFYSKKLFSLILAIGLTLILFCNLGRNTNSIENTKQQNDKSEEISLTDQLFDAFVFNHKEEIYKLESYFTSHKQEIYRSFRQEKLYKKIQFIFSRDYVLHNFYSSYYEENNLEKNFFINSYMLFYVKDFEGLSFYNSYFFEIELLDNSSSTTISSSFTPKNLDNLINFYFFNISTKYSYFNDFLNEHIFILKYREDVDGNFNINSEYYVDDLTFWYQVGLHRYYFKFPLLFNSKESFNYEKNFYYTEPKMNITNIVLSSNQIMFNINLLVPTNYSINEILKNSYLKVNFKKIYSSNNMGTSNFSLANYNFLHKYGHSSWYSLSFVIDNSLEGGIEYYDFSFYFNNQQIILDNWNKNIKFITPYKEIPIDSFTVNKQNNSYIIDIIFQKDVDYIYANNLVISYYYEDSVVENFYHYSKKFLKVSNKISDNHYQYKLSGFETTEIKNLVLVNSGYFDYDFRTNSFEKNYQKNENFIYYDYDFYDKDIQVNVSNNIDYPYVQYLYFDKENDEIILKAKSNNIVINSISNLYTIKLSYFSKNDLFSDYKFTSKEIILSEKPIKLSSSFYEFHYEFNYDKSTIYKSPFITLNDHGNYNIYNSYFLRKNYYISNFNNLNSEILNVDLVKHSNNNIIFNITFKNIDLLQAQLIEISYFDSGGNQSNASIGNNLFFNGIIENDNLLDGENILTLQFSLFNLKENEEYKYINFYIPEIINSNIYDEFSINYSDSKFSLEYFKTTKISLIIKKILFFSFFMIILVLLVGYLIFYSIFFKKNIKNYKNKKEKINYEK